MEVTWSDVLYDGGSWRNKGNLLPDWAKRNIDKNYEFLYYLEMFISNKRNMLDFDMSRQTYRKLEEYGLL